MTQFLSMCDTCGDGISKKICIPKISVLLWWIIFHLNPKQHDFSTVPFHLEIFQRWCVVVWYAWALDLTLSWIWILALSSSCSGDLSNILDSVSHYESKNNGLFFVRNGGNVKSLPSNKPLINGSSYLLKLFLHCRTFSTLKIKRNMKIKKLLGRGEHSCWGKRWNKLLKV